MADLKKCYQQTSSNQIHHKMHVTSCSKIKKTTFHSTLMYSPQTVATQHPRTAGEQASTALRREYYQHQHYH